MMKHWKAAKKEEINESIATRLWKAYKEKIIPVEERYKFTELNGPHLGEGDFSANPMVLLIGQYSTGKTTFIRYILDEDFPGIRIGPEPTTDRFTVVMYGEDRQVIPGNVAAIDPKLQFRPLTMFGNHFLSHFNCVFTKNPVLQNLTLIDTPGILSGEKQRVNRGYDFDGVLDWFAERVDKIIILFDAHKLDISDELANAIHVIKERQSKIIVVLNKADGMDNQQLLRVYGALMWNLSKILNSPEVTRVFIGSFWDKPLVHVENKQLFELEEADLFSDLSKLPGTSMVRKLDDACLRARSVKIHACLMAHIKSVMPLVLGKQSKKNQLLNSLDSVYDTVSEKYGLPKGDFPPLERMKKYLEQLDFKEIEPYRARLITSLNDFLTTNLPELTRRHQELQREDVTFSNHLVKGGVFDGVETPFVGEYDGINKGKFTGAWPVEQYRGQWGKDFKSLNPMNGKISGEVARENMLEFHLQRPVLKKIWLLSDLDKDGCLTEDEYLLVRYLIDLKVRGYDLPNTLPEHLVPPSFRTSVNAVSDVIANEHELTY